MICRFLRAASSMSSSACATVEVNGFSTKTCLPFSSAALAISKCVQTGVITATASMHGDRNTSSTSEVTETDGFACEARFREADDLSQITDNWQPLKP